CLFLFLYRVGDHSDCHSFPTRRSSDLDAYLQLDDAVIVDTEVPGRGPLRVSGIVQDVRARHEGASFDTDVFLVERGVLPVDTAVDRKSTRLNSSHQIISYAVFCLKIKK